MKTLRKVAVLSMCVLAFAAPAVAGDHAKMSELPSAVRQTVERETKGATVTDIERDTEDGKAIYEVEYVKDGQRWELDVSSSGTVLKRHRD
jgi:uncharacterized protein YpmB